MEDGEFWWDGVGPQEVFDFQIIIAYIAAKNRPILSMFRAERRDVIEGGEGYHLREEAAPYIALFEAEKDDIGAENAYFWEINSE